jgi:hypothetical protein
MGSGHRARLQAGVSVGLLWLVSVSGLGAQAPTVGPVPRVVWFSGTFQPANGLPPATVESVTLSIYRGQDDGGPVWEETQHVVVGSDGRYHVLLGSTTAEGLPRDLFTAGEPRWLGVHFNRDGEVDQPRIQLASVPYALKAADADTLGGRPASAYLLAPGAGSAGEAASNGAGHAGGAAAGGDPVSPRAVLPGTTNFLAKYVNGVDVGDSALFEGAGRVGLGTTTPSDYFHVRFTNANGAFTGLAVQNLGNTAASYSGMLFYDQNGALGQFQGFNNVTHEYRINNIASGGSINFMLGGTSRFLVANTGSVTVSGSLAANGGVSARGRASFTATGTVSVSNASSTVTGSGTAFLTEVQVGDRLQVGADSRPVTAIASDTSLTVSSAYPSSSAGAATVFPVLLRIDNASGATQGHVNDQGNMQLGAVFSATNKLLVYQANRFAGTSTTSSYNNGNLLVATSGTAAADVGGTIALGGNRGTTAGGATFGGLRGAKENGTDNDTRGYLGLYTTDVGNTFAERARLSSTGNLGVGTVDPGQRIEVNGGVRLNTVTARPACDATVRGTFWVTQQGAGQDDLVEVCVKNAADVFVWRTVL